MWRRIVAIAVIFALWGCGSGEVRERPEDCANHQYFDETREQCRTCAAVVEPECPDGCGLEVVEDQRGCPVLRCHQGCSGCEEGEVWNPQEERCEGE